MIGAGSWGVLRARNPRLIVMSAALSGYGDGFFAVAMAALMLHLGGPSALTALAAITYVGAIAASPIAGQLADRVSRRTILVAADLLRAACMLTVALALHWDFASMPLVLLINGVCTLAGTAFRSARMSLLPSTVPAGDLFALNAVDGAITTSSMILGPALCAGVILLGADRAALFLIDGTTFLASAALLASLTRVEPSSPVVADQGSRDGHWTRGFSFLAAARETRWAHVLIFLNHAGAGALFVLLPVAASAASGDVGIGYVEAALGVGLVSGMLSGGTFGKRDACLTATVGVSLLGVTLALVGLSPILVVLCVAACVAGFATCLADSPLTTVVQLATPDALRGRVSSVIDALGCAGLLAGSTAFGVLTTAFGLRSAGATVGIAVASVALASAFLRQRHITGPIAADAERG